MNSKNDNRDTKEFKESVLDRMIPPNNEINKEFSKGLWVSEPMLYDWGSEDKFLVVLETTP